MRWAWVACRKVYLAAREKLALRQSHRLQRAGKTVASLDAHYSFMHFRKERVVLKSSLHSL